MIGNFDLPEAVDDDMDIYDALGLNTPTGPAPTSAPLYDPLAAFMDDDEESIEEGVFVQTSAVSDEHVESLLATLARDLLDHERLSASLSGGRVDMESLRIERDRDAYHLSLIVDMGGEQIKPFATVLAVKDTWQPMTAPKSLHAQWKPVYDSLCQALTEALTRQGRPSTL
jgi:hypothetical protein